MRKMLSRDFGKDIAAILLAALMLFMIFLAGGCNEPLTAYRIAAPDLADGKRILVLPFMDTRTFVDAKDPYRENLELHARDIFVDAVRSHPALAKNEILTPDIARPDGSITIAEAAEYGRQYNADLVVAGQIFSFTDTRAASIPPRAGMFIRVVSARDGTLAFIGDHYLAAPIPLATGGREAQATNVASKLLDSFASQAGPGRTGLSAIASANALARMAPSSRKSGIANDDAGAADPDPQPPPPLPELGVAKTEAKNGGDKPEAARETSPEVSTSDAAIDTAGDDVGSVSEAVEPESTATEWRDTESVGVKADTGQAEADSAADAAGAEAASPEPAERAASAAAVADNAGSGTSVTLLDVDTTTDTNAEPVGVVDGPIVSEVIDSAPKAEETAVARSGAVRMLMLPYHDRDNPNNLIEHTGGGEVVTAIFGAELAMTPGVEILWPGLGQADHNRLLSQSEALELARRSGADFVLRGQVVEFRRAQSVPSFYSALISTAMLAAQMFLAEFSGVDVATEVYRVSDGACVMSRRDRSQQKYVVQAEKTVRRMAGAVALSVSGTMTASAPERMEPLIDTLEPRTINDFTN